MLQNQTQTTSPAVLTSEADRRRRIREMNDTFRRQDSATAFMLGEIVKAPRLQELPWGEQWAVIERVKRYAHFDDANEPEGLHDYGAFLHKGRRYFWKIDYIDPKMPKLSEDPSDPTRCVRYLTIHLTEEP